MDDRPSVPSHLRPIGHQKEAYPYAPSPNVTARARKGHSFDSKAYWEARREREAAKGGTPASSRSSSEVGSSSSRGVTLEKGSAMQSLLAEARRYAAPQQTLKRITQGATFPQSPLTSPRCANGLYVHYGSQQRRQQPLPISRQTEAAVVHEEKEEMPLTAKTEPPAADDNNNNSNNNNKKRVETSPNRRALMSLQAYDSAQVPPKPPPILEPKDPLLLQHSKKAVTALPPITPTDPTRYLGCYEDGVPRRLGSTLAVKAEWEFR